MASLSGKMSKMTFQDKPQYIVVLLSDEEIHEKYKKTEEFAQIAQEEYKKYSEMVAQRNQRLREFRSRAPRKGKGKRGNLTDITLETYEHFLSRFQSQIHSIHSTPDSFSFKCFEEKVNAKMAEGYTPQGGIAMESSRRGLQPRWAQAMILKNSGDSDDDI